MRYFRPVVVLVVMLFAVSAAAQTTTGSLSGTVVDAQDQVVPGADITLTNQQTQEVRRAVSNQVGLFEFPGLQPGPYTVRAELSGFRPYERRDNMVLANIRLALPPFRLEVGSLAEAVTVSAVGELVGTTQTAHQAVLDLNQVENLSIRGRDPMSLLKILPGVQLLANDNETVGGGFNSPVPTLQGGGGQTVYVDGINGGDGGGGGALSGTTVMDAIAEVNVQMSAYTAEYGLKGGSQINVITKHGGAEYHGTGYWYRRHEMWNSINYFNKITNRPKPQYRYSNLGGTLGGPIPRVKGINPDGNKLFFFYVLDDTQAQRVNLLRFYRVPTALERAGDFSQSIRPNGTLVVVTDPTTGQPFPGNRIPANRIHPISVKLLEFYPEPNATGTDATGTVNNYVSQQNRVIDKDQFTQRFDFVQSSSSTWMGRYSHSRDDEINPSLKLNGTKLVNRIHQAMVGNTRTLSPTVVNEFRFGYNSFYNTFGRELAFVRDVTSELAIPGMAALPETAWGIPSIGIQGLSGFGDGTEGPYTNRNKVFEIIDNVSWIKGRHSFKVGGHFRIDHYNQVGNQFPRGGFQFDGRATGSLTGVLTPIAPSFADFLLGYQRLSELSVQLAVTEFRAFSQSYYMTDTWRMSDNMTLDLGLRYEYVPPFQDQAGTLINASMPFFDQGLPVADMARHPTLVRIGEGNFYEDFNIRYNPAIQTARDGRLGNRLVDDDKLNIAPRAGWAWTPTPLTSIRAGVGMFYMQDTGNPRFDMARNAAGRRQDTSNQFFGQNWNAPFVGSGTNACNSPAGIVCISNHYVLGNDYDRSTPRMLQYLFNVQREIGGNAAIEIGYLGSRSSELERMFDRNDVVLGVGGVQERRPYPEFTRVQTIGNVAEARYNSLTAKLTRRLNNGFSALIGYTLSKSEDNGSGIRTLNGDQLFPQNSNCAADEAETGCEWGRSIFDSRHRIVSSILYELPFGKGKKWAQDGVGNAILGGWQLTNIMSLSSGFARNPSSGDRANLGHGDQRPNAVSGQDPDDGPKTLQAWFNTSAYVLQSTTEYGNAVRNGLTGPGIFNFDTSILRNFMLGGSKTLQLRLEAFNTFNQPVWNDPNTSVISAQYGNITSTRKPMRELQLGVKFGF